MKVLKKVIYIAFKQKRKKKIAKGMISLVSYDKHLVSVLWFQDKLREATEVFLMN